MVRLIDADAIEHCLVIGGRRHGKTIISEFIRRAIQAAPTVDAVPVIRCKECKHNRDGICGWHYGTGYRWVVDDDDDFCSVGERKEE